MGDLDKILARAEVLAQIIGVLGDLSFNLLLIFGLTKLNAGFKDGILKGNLWGKVESIAKTLRDDEELPSKLNWQQILLRYGVVMLVGFTLGYVLQSNYFTGQITLLITTSRISSYYKLLMWSVVFILEALVLLSLSMLEKLKKRGVEGKAPALFSRVVDIANWVMVLIAIALVIGCVVVCYVSVGSQF